MARTLVLGFSLAIICLLAFLTVSAGDRCAGRPDYAPSGWLGAVHRRFPA